MRDGTGSARAAAVRLSLACLILLVSSASALATELTFDAVPGAGLPISGAVGYGNALNGFLWGDGGVENPPLSPDERRLDSFGFWVTSQPGATDLQYRLGIGLTSGGSFWSSDIFTTDWQTLTASDNGAQHVEAVIPSGLVLDSGTNYMLYLLGDNTSLGWSIETTRTNVSGLIVGIGIAFYSDSKFVDTDLPHDRDVAMTASFSKVPEPNLLILLSVGAGGLAISRRRRH